MTLSDPESLATDSLVAQSRHGDLDAFARLVATVQPQVFRWALAFAADADEAEDVVQETFVLALRHLGQYRGSGTFRIWLYQITRRVAGHLRRTRMRRAKLSAAPRAIPDRVLYETDPGGRVDRERLAAVVRRFWQELPERQREVVDLVDLQGLAPTDAAEMLGLRPATLRANLFKGRHAMRRRLLAHFGRESQWLTGGPA